MGSRSSHTERTASQPRQSALHLATLSSIRLINPRIRLLRLTLPYVINFLPGQWLDVHIPSLPKAGGFTITSTPKCSNLPPTASHKPYFELAIQKSPANPPAAWLWRPTEEILGTELKVRVGGNFVWPPPNLDVKRIKRLVLVAGGVGINPLISIVTHLRENGSLPDAVHFLYATKIEGGQGLHEVLFWPRLSKIFEGAKARGPGAMDLSLFATGSGTASQMQQGTEANAQSVHLRRLGLEDLWRALGPTEQRGNTVAYVCGPAGMTDEIVELLKGQEGMSEDRVLCEKWW